MSTDNPFTIDALAEELRAYTEQGLGRRPVFMRAEDGRRLEIIDIWYEGEDELTIQIRPVGAGVNPS